MQKRFDRGNAEAADKTTPARGWRRNLAQAADRVRSKPLAAMAVLLVLAAGLWWWRLVQGPEVGAVPAARGTAVEIVYATGAVEPLRWAKVTSLVRNRIIDVCYCEGKTVAKGDVLARLDDKELRKKFEKKGVSW